MKNFSQTFKPKPDFTLTIKRVIPDKSLFENKKLIPLENSAYFGVAS